MRSIDAVAFAEVLDALPARLRKRLDAAVERAADWAREPDPAGGGESVRVDDETTVTLRLTAGVVRAAADVACNCLLAPACLHRAAVAASLRIHDPDTAHEPEVQTPETPPEGETAAVVAETVAEPVAAESAPTATLTAAATTATATSTATAMPNPVPLTVRERVALEALWDSAAAVLVAGLVGANLFTEAELARATHQVRALRLHRAAALGARVVAGLRVARERRVEHRLEQYTADLRELLLTTHQLTHTTDPADLAELRGISRRSYSEHASMRLYGLFTEPVVARSGHAGVVGYAVDGSGVVWSSASIAPGGFELVRPSYDSALKLGGTTLTQRELGRHGLLVSGASSSPDRRLGSGGATKAVRTAGIAWSEAPIAGLFDEPLAAQFARALRADREAQTYRAGDDLVFLRARVLGAEREGLVLELEDPQDDPQDDPRDGVRAPAGLVRCVALGTAAVYRRNFARLAESESSLMLIARPDKANPGTVYGLAVHDAGLSVPEAWSGRVNLGLDRIPDPEEGDERAAPEVAESGLEAEPAGQPPLPIAHAVDRTALHLVRSHVEQTASAGRAIARTAMLDRDCARLTREALHTAAALLRDLQAQAVPVRDEFQRPVATPGHPNDGYARAWLAAAVYAQAAAEDLTVSRWLRALG